MDPGDEDVRLARGANSLAVPLAMWRFLRDDAAVRGWTPEQPLDAYLASVSLCTVKSVDGKRLSKAIGRYLSARRRPTKKELDPDGHFALPPGQSLLERIRHFCGEGEFTVMRKS
jgi:hypothetical protein